MSLTYQGDDVERTVGVLARMTNYQRMGQIQRLRERNPDLLSAAYMFVQQRNAEAQARAKSVEQSPQDDMFEIQAAE